MSAYVVSVDHIAYLVQAGLCRVIGTHHSRLRWYWNIDREAGTFETAELAAGDLDQEQRVGQMLWSENVASVRARYPDTPDRLPGPVNCDYRYPYHGLDHHDNFNPVQILKACDCYEYQACEHHYWPKSEAKAYIDALRGRAWRALPGYADAVWGNPPSPAQLRREARERSRVLARVEGGAA